MLLFGQDCFSNQSSLSENINKSNCWVILKFFPSWVSSKTVATKFWVNFQQFKISVCSPKICSVQYLNLPKHILFTILQQNVSQDAILKSQEAILQSNNAANQSNPPILEILAEFAKAHLVYHSAVTMCIPRCSYAIPICSSPIPTCTPSLEIKMKFFFPAQGFLNELLISQDAALLLHNAVIQSQDSILKSPDAVL